MKKAKRRLPTPQVMVKCTRCKRTAVRYEYGWRGTRVRWKKSATRPKPMGSCYLCGGKVERIYGDKKSAKTAAHHAVDRRDRRGAKHPRPRR